MIWFWIGSGGALGAVLRFYIATSVGRSSVVGFPLGIFSVNVLGCALMGVVYVLIERLDLPEEFRFFLTVGLLGAFTTFSTFSLEVYELLVEGRSTVALAYMAATLFGCVLALAAGVTAARWVLGH
mgnify:FL=1